MITVLGMWEAVWMEAERTERRLWKQTLAAFGVDAWGMCGIQGGPFTTPTQHVDLAAMLAAYPGPKTFLIPPDRTATQDLRDYAHPTDAIYVFGNTHQSMAGHVTADDDVVSIFTPVASDMFGHVTLAAVLYDRVAKT